MKKRDLVLGIDASTTACKAVIWDSQGRAVAGGRAPLTLLMPQPSWHEQRAGDWWTALCGASRQALAGIDTGRVAALAIAHQRETFVLVDADGRPLRDAIVWMDERARTVLPALSADVSAARVQSVTGKRLAANLTLAKTRWLHEHEPDRLRQAHKLLDTHAWLVHRLTGQFRTGRGSADPTGMFDMRHHCWAADLIAAAGARVEQMAEIVAPGTVVGAVTAEAAAASGLPQGLPVVAGLGDGQAAGLGVNLTRPGAGYLNLGTAVVSGVFSDVYLTTDAFRTTYSGIGDACLLETVILGGSYTIDWFCRQFGETPEAMEPAAAALPPGAQGLLLVPYWNSAMNPFWDATASGIVVGWRGVHGKAHLYRAIMEGIALEQRLQTLAVEQATGRAVDEYILMGGGARSPLWRQIIADVTGKPVAVAAAPEAAALGAGILAAAGAGLHGSIQAAAAAMTQPAAAGCTPDAARHASYTSLYEDVYTKLYPSLRQPLQRLTELSDTGGI